MTLNKTFVAASALALVAVSPAFAAGDQESVDACRAALESEYAGAELTFKSISGVTSTRKVTFEIATDGSEELVTCKVKRGSVLALNGTDYPRVASN